MWMNLEDIMLSQIVSITRHRKTNTIRSHVYVKSKIAKLIERKSKIVVPKSLGRGDDDQRLQSFSNAK